MVLKIVNSSGDTDGDFNIEGKDSKTRLEVAISVFANWIFQFFSWKNRWFIGGGMRVAEELGVGYRQRYVRSEVLENQYFVGESWICGEVMIVDDIVVAYESDVFTLGFETQAE